VNLSRSPSNDDESCVHALSDHQRAAAASPEIPLSDLVGNFSDFDRLFEQLGQPQLIELGKPLPGERFLPKKRVGKCPAAHNKALLGARRRGLG
jgi:hypothetical protein